MNAELDLSLDRIARAAETIDPLFLNTPQYVDGQLCERLGGRRVLVKVETLNPLRSFKGRGADFHVGELARRSPGATVVCGSGGGNFAQAIAWAARRHGLRAEVFMPAGMSPVKLRRAASLGATVHAVSHDVKAAARAYAAGAADRVFVEDGRDAAVAEGAGTIGVELLRDGAGAEPFGAVVLPLGDGALITGVARWVKAHAPGVRVLGAASVNAPALYRSWRTGEVTEAVPENVFAAGINITRPTAEAVARTRALVDDIVLVTDEELLSAMRLAAETLGVLPEPAGAAGLAAVAAHGGALQGDDTDADANGTVATVITGANADPQLLFGVS
ncbi:threonine ammonia-lyase [Streptomyces sp. 6N223]|uniref:threonine ammonia-lyase n=1 Tax=Streptomyces sp. 6N223 TaxID=3457412 RepID=UPI003FD46A7A